MHHGKHLKRLGRKTTLHRQDMLRNMLTSLIKHGRIETTWTKAKSLQRLADKIVTYFKKGQDHHVVLAKNYIREHEITIPRLQELAKRFQDRPGGYTRVHKYGTRYGDNAPVGIIEYVGEPNDIKKFMTIKAEAKRRLEKDSKELLTSAEIKELLETSKTKQMLLPKHEFKRLMHLKKSMQNFERKVEQVKKDHFLDENAWNEEVQKEMKLMTESMSKLTV